MHVRLSTKFLLAISLCFMALPALAATDEALGGTLSTNWAGYAAADSRGYSAVGATWAVPAPATSSAPMSADATWVGIGGIKKKDLIQAGTQAITKNGRTTYRAWYELLPDYQRPIPLEVRGSDMVRVTLSEFSPGLWLLVFENLTTGAQYNKVLEYESSHSSAEWIQEMPHITSGGTSLYAPLSEFGVVQFEDAYATARGAAKSPEEAKAKPITMVSKSGKQVVLAAPGDIEDDGFVVTRSSAVPSPARAGKRSQADPSDIVWSKQ